MLTHLPSFQLLHDFDAEPDLLAVAQASLLLSINHQCSKTSTVWLTHSHVAAQRLGLENKSSYSMMKPDKSNLCKRLWWSLFIRDNTLRLELGTPQRFQDTPYDVPPLTIESFDLSEFPVTLRHALPDAILVQNAEIHRRLALLAIRRAELACHLSQILAISNKPPMPHTAKSRRLSIYFEQSLENWYTEHEPHLRFDPGHSPVLDHHCGLLSLLYFGSSNALLKEHLQQSPDSSAVDLAVRLKMENDTRKALNVARTLYMSGSYIPPTLGMGMVYNAVNVFVQLAEWRKCKKATPLPLDPAIKCLCALIKSTTRGTAVEIALCHLESRIKALDVPTSDTSSALLKAGLVIDDDLSSSLRSSPQASLLDGREGEDGEHGVSIDELFDMAIRSDRSFSPQPGFGVSADAEGETTSPQQYNSPLGIPIPL